ncbi:hypothetical protein L1987_31849 [Smallanthus sonchifolius]|uniref:Uncharacterized protein n=1 Tax=Smallanthus sonchifolius TaxID=185202 RepID=A0ACB9I6Q3_9ASTR|nr:hypothetical protein L1987_31849 [Smallanthus sonchifolius]
MNSCKSDEELCEMDSKRCKTTDAISVMDGSKSHVGVRRSRDTEVTSSDSSKRTKFDPRDQENVAQLENQCRSGVDVNSPEDVVSTAESGDHVSSFPCLKNDSSLDLKAELRFESETSMSSNDGFRETSASSEICLDSDEMDSSSPLKTKPAPIPASTSRRKPSTASDIPTAAEIDEFFSAMENKEQKRFADKYNYDIVNDVPMEGRYQWVMLKP